MSLKNEPVSVEIESCALSDEQGTPVGLFIIRSPYVNYRGTRSLDSGSLNLHPESEGGCRICHGGNRKNGVHGAVIAMLVNF